MSKMNVLTQEKEIQEFSEDVGDLTTEEDVEVLMVEMVIQTKGMLKVEFNAITVINLVI